MTSRPYHVLLLCTANHCRSPLAAALLRRGVREAGLEERVSIASAAITDAMEGCDPSATVVEIGRRRGVEVAGAARRVSPEMLAAADLVVCMDEGQVEAVEEDPSTMGRVRLLLSFAPALGRREVPDPHGLGEPAHEAVADLIEVGISGLLGHLAAETAVRGR
jgi:protein-tyrosine phosphatase